MQTKAPLKKQSLIWPIGFEIGVWIEWDVYVTKTGRGSGWKTKSGRIVSIARWQASIWTGKYVESISLKDLYIGLVILKMPMR